MSAYLPDDTTQADIDRANQGEPPYQCAICGNEADDCVCFDMGAAEEDTPMPHDGAERYEADWLEIRDSQDSCGSQNDEDQAA